MAQAMMGADLAGMPCQRMLPLLGEPVLDLLDDKLPVSQAVRVSVLHLIRLLIAGLRDGCSSTAGVCSFARPMTVSFLLWFCGLFSCLDLCLWSAQGRAKHAATVPPMGIQSLEPLQELMMLRPCSQSSSQST